MIAVQKSCIHASAVAVCVEWCIDSCVCGYIVISPRHCTLGASLCLGGRSHEAYCNRVVCHYASVGGATRHTVIALSVILSVSLSVTPFLRRTLNGEL